MPTVEIDVDLDHFSDVELIEEMEDRGYYVSETQNEIDLDNEDLEFLLEILNNKPFHWYTERVRNKLLNSRYGTQ